MPMPTATAAFATPTLLGGARTRRESAQVCTVAASLSAPGNAPPPSVTPSVDADASTVIRSDAEWRARLSPAAHAVLRQGRTEWPFTSELLDEKRAGVFTCGGCKQPLFDSRTKYSSGTGWPSFWRPLANAIRTKQSFLDRVLGQREVSCERCDGHLGHVFRDGPPPTGERYCINGIALDFVPSEE